MTLLYFASGTPATQPNPSTLATPNPYPVPLDESLINWKTTPSLAWSVQGAKALVYEQSYDRGVLSPIRLSFIPSNPAATYTLALWTWDTTELVWFLTAPYEVTSTPTYTTKGLQYTVTYPPGAFHPTPGTFTDYIYEPTTQPMYIQIVSISAGTLTILTDGNALPL